MSKTRYLLDTNVLSETRRARADQRVLDFLAQANPSGLYLSCLSLGELRKGVSLKLKSDPPAGRAIGTWVEGIEDHFADRILPIDSATARLWGEWSAQRPRPVIDTLLAATASVRDLTFVTRNEGDVSDLPIRTLNPWKS